MARSICARVLQQAEMFSRWVQMGSMQPKIMRSLIHATVMSQEWFVWLYIGVVSRGSQPMSSQWSVLILAESFVDVVSQYSMFVMIQREFGRGSTLRI